MKIAVIGTGYVGLVTGTCFAETGNDVICVDIDQDKVARMRKGEVPIYEPHLDVLFERNTKAGRLTFTTSLAEAIQHSEVVFLALPTPPGEDGSADLTHVLKVAEEIGGLITDYKIIIDKSTVPVGTAELVREKIALKATCDFDVVSNPEFLREGFAVDDFLKPERVVIGTESEKARKILESLYESFVRQGNPIVFMDEKSAELTKYAANAFLATKITFMNEIANFCEKVGADVDKVRLGIGSDSRIGKRFLFPGIGYGGSCFPKDVKALIHSGKEVGYDFAIINAVEEVNAKQKQLLVKKIKEHGRNLKGVKVAIWGLSFKPETDDIREAPSIEVINALLAEGAKVSAFDPEAMAPIKAIYKDRIHLASDQYEAAESAEMLLVLTEWAVFRSPDFKRLKEALNQPLIYDGRNVFDVDRMKDLGFEYYSIGR